MEKNEFYFSFSYFLFIFFEKFTLNFLYIKEIRKKNKKFNIHFKKMKNKIYFFPEQQTSLWKKQYYIFSFFKMNAKFFNFFS